MFRLLRMSGLDRRVRATFWLFETPFRLASYTFPEPDVTRGGDPVTTYGGRSKRVRPLEANASREWKALGIPACASATH